MGGRLQWDTHTDTDTDTDTTNDTEHADDNTT
jgi:hypothetical protein